MMVEITKGEAQVIVEALELAIDEIRGAEDVGDWVATTGALDFCRQGIGILRSALLYIEIQEDKYHG